MIKSFQKYFKEFLDFLNIDEKFFFEIRDKFTNRELFETDNNYAIKKDKNNQLILNNTWYKKSFE